MPVGLVSVHSFLAQVVDSNSIQILLGCTAVFLYILLFKDFGQGDWLEELLIGQLLLLEGLLEPQGRDDLDAFKLERVSDCLGASLTPN